MRTWGTLGHGCVGVRVPEARQIVELQAPPSFSSRTKSNSPGVLPYQIYSPDIHSCLFVSRAVCQAL